MDGEKNLLMLGDNVLACNTAMRESCAVCQVESRLGAVAAREAELKEDKDHLIVERRIVEEDCRVNEERYR